MEKSKEKVLYSTVEGKKFAEKHYSNIFGYLKNNSNIDEIDLYDIACNAMATVFLKIKNGSYQEQGKIDAYIVRCAKNYIKNYYREKARGEKRAEQAIKEYYIQQNFESDMEQAIQNEELIYRMYSCIDKAMKNGIELLKQRSEDKSIKELSEIYQTSEGGIKSKLRRIRTFIKDCMQKNNFID